MDSGLRYFQQSNLVPKRKTLLSVRVGNRAELCRTVAVSRGSVIKLSASPAR